MGASRRQGVSGGKRRGTAAETRGGLVSAGRRQGSQRWEPAVLVVQALMDAAVLWKDTGEGGGLDQKGSQTAYFLRGDCFQSGQGWGWGSESKKVLLE